MLIAKRAIGWLSPILLIASVVIVGRGIFQSAYPFFNGGKLIAEYGWEPDKLAEELGQNWDSKTPIANLMDGTDTYVRGERLTYTGFEAVIEALKHSFVNNLDDRATLRRIYSSEDLLPVILFDLNGNALAASPARLRYTPVDAPFGSHEWEWLFAHMASTQLETIDPNFSTLLIKVKNKDGKHVGYLAAPAVASTVYQLPSYMNLPGFQDLLSMLALAIGMFILSWLLLVIWTAMDASWRGTNGFAWGFLVLITHWIGWLAFLLARPSAPASCPNCDGTILARFLRCPSCGFALPKLCGVCKTSLKPGWSFCPTCSATGTNLLPEETVQVRSHVNPLLPDVPDASSSERKQVTIQVSDALTGSPLSKVQVAIEGTELAGLTDYLGNYTIGLIPEGAAYAVVTNDGYCGQKVRMDTIKSNDIARVLLEPVPGTISISVTSFEDGDPLANVRIFADSEKLDSETISAPDGSAELQQVTPGFYTLVAELQGYEPQTRLAEVLPGKRSSVAFLLSSMPLAVGQTEEMQ